LLRLSSVFACFLDCSKAFDLVNHNILFNILKSKGLPNIYIRILAYSYKSQQASVCWNNTLSIKFGIRNGVRQGGILSPIFFSLYIDKLFYILCNSGVGCYFADMFVGAVAYADDLVLLSPSLRGLKCLLCLTNQFMHSVDLKFNSDKTICMKFDISPQPLRQFKLELNNIQLKWVHGCTYLGIRINRFLNDNDHFSYLISDLFSKFNFLCSQLFDIHPRVFIKLVVTYCTSFYGSSVCVINSVNYFRLCTAWNRCLRRSLKLPYQTHRQYLPALTGVDLLDVTLPTRCVKFALSCLTSSNPLISIMSRYSCLNYRHILGKNVLPILSKVDLHPSELLKCNSIELNKIIFCKLSLKYKDIDFGIIDLINCLLDPPNDCILSSYERLYLIKYLCCD